MKTVIVSPNAPAAVGPYSQAIKANGMLFTAGQLGIDPKTGQFAGEDVAAQTRQAMNNLKAVLEAGNANFDTVVKTTIFLTDMADFKIVNSIYAEFFGGDPPARSTVQVAALPLGGRIEIEMLALVAE